ncbi:MAG: cysteine--tRNA ligase [Neisseriaceae bacterium]|nr:cysteine--tRNA ligase [Neisseriaceae bacterium PsAf]MCV2508899.1 cysteine--tRNA ligase [Neisseriaceae bacterium]
MLKIYNTITKQKEEFQPINPEAVSMYVCGMTVYDYCHLGHARLMVVFDIISRWIKELGYPLTYVRNITDIDDKIIAVAQKNKIPYQEVTAKFIQAMHEDSDALGILRPDIEPRATEYIPKIIQMIETLINNHKAYVADNGDVYYSVREFPAYGQLSGKNPDDLRAGERVDINEAKQDPLDFALWKAAKPDEPYWPSPWGDGRPGWHIECSTMSASLFGEIFDIHGGGADLQFPHHENELAQNCGVNHHFAIEQTQPKLIQSHVKYWIHNGFIRVDNEKMSKSLGNFFTIREILEQYPAEVVRFFLLRTHYRSPLNYSDAHLTDAKNALTRLYTTLKNTSPSQDLQDISYEDNNYTERFFTAMNEDFNTTEAVAVLFELSSEINKTQDRELASYLKFLGNKLGILTQEPIHFLQGDEDSSSLSSEEIEHLIAQRKTARETKNWAESDRIRDLLLENDIILEDSAQGTTWRKK